MERVRVHLAPLIRQQRVDFLADTDIRSGEQWRERIETMIDSASAAILLVSADFLASDFIADHELPQLLSAARQTGLVILPVFVGAALLEAVPEIIGIQGVNTPDRPLTMLTKGEQDHVLRDLARRALDLSRSGGSEVR